jgi:hypothetical protein
MPLSAAAQVTCLEAIMLPIIRSRIDGRRLARKLRESLADPKGTWAAGADDEGRPALSNGEFRIVLVPRTLRILDAIHVYHDDAEIWLPLVARLRLRGAARARLIQDAAAQWDKPATKKSNAGQRRAKAS